MRRASGVHEPHKGEAVKLEIGLDPIEGVRYVRLGSTPLTETESAEAAAFVYAMRRGWFLVEAQSGGWVVYPERYTMCYTAPTLAQAVQKAREATKSP